MIFPVFEQYFGIGSPGTQSSALPLKLAVEIALFRGNVLEIGPRKTLPTAVKIRYSEIGGRQSSEVK